MASSDYKSYSFGLEKKELEIMHQLSRIPGNRGNKSGLLRIWIREFSEKKYIDLKPLKEGVDKKMVDDKISAFSAELKSRIKDFKNALGE